MLENISDLVLQNVQQWAGGGDKSDEVCEEAKQEVVSQAREHDHQQLGELVPEMPKCQKNGSCFLAFFSVDSRNCTRCGARVKTWS